MMKKLILFLALIAVCLVSTLAAAAPATPVTAAPFGDTLSAFLTTTIFPIFGALALGFVSWAAQKIGAKFKIQSLAEKNNFVTRIAAQGVAFAEEKAANFAKTAQPLTGNDKLNAAIAYVLQNAPKVSEAQAQSVVTAALAMLPGVGATGAATVGTTPGLAPVAPVVPRDPLAVSP